MKRITLLSLAFVLLAAPVFGAWQNPPEPLTTSGDGATPDIAANSDGDALAVWIDNTTVKASHFANGAWGTFTNISTNAGTNSLSKVAYDDSGNGLAIWVANDPPNRTVHSAFFNGTTWTEPPITPLDTATNPFISPAVAMDGTGKGLSVWVETVANTVHSSIFNFSFWSSQTTIGTGNGAASIAMSKNGTGVAVWINGGIATANQFISNAWQVAAPIGQAGDSEPDVGMDSNGKAHAVWLLVPGRIMTSTFNGTSWSASQEISSGVGNINPHIAVAPGGTAVATWIDSSNALQSALYNGTSWSAPVLVSSTPPAKEQDVSVAANGNALVLWASSTSNEIDSAALPLNGSWGFQEVVRTSSNAISGIRSAFSSTGSGFGVWLETAPDLSTNAFGSFTLGIIPPSPPASIEGKVRKNSSATQTDRLHIIKFEPSTDTAVIFYRLRRDGIIIAEIPKAGPYKYIDHHRSSKVENVYTVAAVAADNIESTVLTVALK